ncbi:hypothetical protein EXU30_03545 [Shewanella maritima]|uniref:Uncharacterized protein n=1 Tax=Shewanella maritima TaxID=2520507 RepID=A0A411PEC0_9GAMM|nr:hypothetical protein [Shewanella maritima]QBF81875.1 hypothetical protein EXU30_03545 [Shewanella maritima]
MESVLVVGYALDGWREEIEQWFDDSVKVTTLNISQQEQPIEQVADSVDKVIVITSSPVNFLTTCITDNVIDVAVLLETQLQSWLDCSVQLLQLITNFRHKVFVVDESLLLELVDDCRARLERFLNNKAQLTQLQNIASSSLNRLIAQCFLMKSDIATTVRTELVAMSNVAYQDKCPDNAIYELIPRVFCDVADYRNELKQVNQVLKHENDITSSELGVALQKIEKEVRAQKELKVKLQQAGSDTAQLERELRLLQRKRADSQVEINSLGSQNSQLQSELESLKRTNAEYETNSTVLQLQTSQLQSELELEYGKRSCAELKYKEQMLELQRQNAELTSDNQLLNSKLVELKEEARKELNAGSNEPYLKIKTELDSARVNLQLIQSELATEKDAKIMLQSEVELADLQVSMLLKELEVCASYKQSSKQEQADFFACSVNRDIPETTLYLLSNLKSLASI